MSDLKKALEGLHTLLVQELLRKIEDGSATSADLNVARQMLKDNGIDCVSREGNPIQQLALTLPFEDINPNNMKEAC